MVTVDTWHGCYRDGWQGMIVPAAFAHPAKYSRSLIQHIYRHAREEGWLHPGETVVDPFGGVALGALDAMLMGCRWIGMELEPRFVQLANDNLSLWLQHYGHLPTCGTAGVMQGDSRQLASALAPAIACVCSSPPYNLPMSQDHNGTRGGQRGSTPSEDGAFCVYGTTPGQLEGLPPGDLAAVITSPPYANGLGKEETYADHAKREKDSHRGIMREKGIVDPYYGTHPAQLGNLPPGSVAAVIDAVVASPPYADGCAHTGGTDLQPQYVQGGAVHHVAYGTQPGQLGALPSGAVEACISSPPYCSGTVHSPGQDGNAVRAKGTTATPWGSYASGDMAANAYSVSPDNLGNGTPDTFWSAAREIVAQAYALLKPGGHAMWVVKSYVRDKEIVDFPGDWRRLCESLGFITLHEHHALLTEDYGTQAGLFGAETDTTYVTAKKSFFRRLAEKNGSPPIDWETILCMRKPLSATMGRLHACIASPPYAPSDTKPTALGSGKGLRSAGDSAARNKGDYHYPTSAANLATMPPGSTP